MFLTCFFVPKCTFADSRPWREEAHIHHVLSAAYQSQLDLNQEINAGSASFQIPTGKGRENGQPKKSLFVIMFAAPFSSFLPN